MQIQDTFLTDLEEKALALIIQDNKNADTLGLTLHDFSNEANREIFRGANKLIQDGSPATVVTIPTTLDSSKVSFSKLTEIASHFVSTGDAKVIRSELKAASVARRIILSLGEVDTYKNIGLFISTCNDLEKNLHEPDYLSGEKLIDKYESLYDKRKQIKESGGALGISTGLYTLDEYAPMKPGDLVVLAARTSIGKSALSLNIAINAAQAKQHVLFCSAEMTWDNLMDRALAILGNGTVKDLENANSAEAYQRAMLEMRELKQHFHLSYKPKMTSKDIVATASSIHTESPLKLIVIDYLQYLSDPRTKGVSETDRIGQMTQRFKQLAGELECVVLLLSQVNRSASQSETGMPRLEHLRSSGSIEQDADTVLLLNREHRASTEAVLQIGKARRGRAGDEIVLTYDPDSTKFTDPCGKKHSYVDPIDIFADLI